MPTPTNQFDIKNEKGIVDSAEKILKLKALRRSKHEDTKDSFNHKEKELAFKKRYGKNIKTNFSYELEGKVLVEYTMCVESDNGAHYSLTEYLKDGLTDKVILSYRKNGENKQNRFDRYVDGEITLADLISMEND